MNLLLSSTQHSGGGIFEVVLHLALIILVGMFVGRLFEKIKIPHITGYLIAGILIGPSVFNIVTSDSIEALGIITKIGLGFIAFGIGSEILFRNLKETGLKVIIITILQALFAVLLVFGALLIFKAPLWLALILGAIATATAPGPIMMLTKKYKAKGPLTDTMLPLVGLDDAIGIVIFGILLSIGNSIRLGGTDISIIELMVEPLKEIGLSIIVGVIIGFFMSKALRITQCHSEEERCEFEVVIAVSVILISVAVAEIGLFGTHLSIILTPMIAGLAFANTADNAELHHTVRVVDSFNPVFLVAFFTLAGAHLNLVSVTKLGLFGVVYILARVVGKLFGSWLGAVITKAHPNVRKWLGITLLPQAGVAIGMAISAEVTLGNDGILVSTIVLAATVVYELFGPLGVKIALQKSGEVYLDNTKK